MYYYIIIIIIIIIFTVNIFYIIYSKLIWKNIYVQGDRGSEYRSTIGIPGGISSDIFPSIEKALAKSGKQLKLLEGKGNDPDTLNKKVVWVVVNNYS